MKALPQRGGAFIVSRVNEQILAWHRRNVIEANAERVAAGVCDMHVPHSEGPVPAVYAWHTKGPAGVGNEIPLCAECCARWRANANTDPDLAPERITEL